MKEMSPGKMLVYLWPEGHWAYAWDKVAINALSRLYGEAKVVDLDRNTEYTLTPEEINSCIEALDAKF